MPRIFISYRRADSKTISGRIYDRLIQSFGKQNIFKDVDNIPAGKDFRGILREATSQCDVMLVIIGNQWLNITDSNGKRRLDDPNDFVRIEVETGLVRDGALVIPVLLQDATMPSSHDLPDSLRELAYKNAIIVRDDPDFHRDMTRLIEQIKAQSLRKQSIPIVPLLTLLIGIIVIGVATLLISQLGGGNTPSTATSPAVQQTTQVVDVPTNIVLSTETQALAQAIDSPTNTISPTDTPTLTNTVEPTTTNIPTLDPTSTPFGGGTGQIAFISNREDDINNIYMINATGSNVAPLTNNGTNDLNGISVFFAWSPNGSSIAFISGDYVNNEIYVMNVDDFNITYLSGDITAFLAPVWSPDSTRIAFTSSNLVNPEIYMMNVDGSNPANLFDNIGTNGLPAWSPDGRQIAFISDRDGNNGSYDIYVMNVDGSNPTQLTDAINARVSLTWSPDGRQIAFISDRDGNNEIYMMNADGSNLINLTHNSASDSGLSWSPDGRQIAFISDRDGNNEIYVMDADGSNPSNITDDSAADSFPAWSPDGTRIAFTSNRDGNNEIYVMDADGSNPSNITDDNADDFFPAWRP